jgi:RimJ/RimL family protein N-acetyltransferase
LHYHYENWQDIINLKVRDDPHNEAARKLYAGFGFEETGKIIDGETGRC